MPEHYRSPEGLTPEEAQLPEGVHEMPDDHATEGSYTREILEKRIESRIAELSPETRAAILRIQSLFEEIQSHQREEGIQDILEDATHIYDEYQDSYTAYKSEHSDEEELQLGIAKAMDALTSIRSMIKLDTDFPPTE